MTNLEKTFNKHHKAFNNENYFTKTEHCERIKTEKNVFSASWKKY